jgi:hypothetical protein
VRYLDIERALLELLALTNYVRYVCLGNAHSL